MCSRTAGSGACSLGKNAAQKVATIETMESEFVALVMSQGACAEEEQSNMLNIHEHILERMRLKRGSGGGIWSRLRSKR